jgi:uncharacterized protein (DUF1684 family)
MMKKYLVLLLTAFFIGAPSYGNGGNNLNKSYMKQVKKHRKKQDRIFKNPETSPLKEKAAGFSHLNYFPIDPGYRVEATFTRTPDSKEFAMPTSDPNRKKRFVKYGTLSFELDGKPYKLAVYKSLRTTSLNQEDYLFLPFKDHTNGNSTYGGGRYLDMDMPKGDKIILDFNYCYNPYCAYSDGWSCPIPPEENHLEVEINAGVKKYEDH